MTIPAGKEILSFPLPGPARTAAIGVAFAGIREFAEGDIAGLRVYAPEALVLRLGAALWLADRKIRGLLDLPSLTLGIVVLTTLDDGPLADHHRDLLWRAFGLPVFDQLRGWDGAVIARECEVHDGLHLDGLHLERRGAASEFHSFEITRDTCECGNETPRLRALQYAKARAAAA